MKTLISQAVKAVTRPLPEVMSRASQELYLRRTHAVDILDSLLHGEKLEAKDILWSFEGGDPVIDARMLPSAQGTAYAALFYANLRDIDYWKGDGDKRSISEKLFDLLRDEATGLALGNEAEFKPLGDCFEDARAVFWHALRLASQRGADGRCEFAWLLGMRTDDGEVNIIVPFDEWLKQQAARAYTDRMAQAYRIVAGLPEVGLFTQDRPTPTEVNETLTRWLHEECDDGEHGTRHERIVDRRSDREYEMILREIIGGTTLRSLVSKSKGYELALASAWREREVEEFKKTPEYEMLVVKRQLEEHEAELRRQAEEEEREEIRREIADIKRRMRGEDLKPIEVTNPHPVAELPKVFTTEDFNRINGEARGRLASSRRGLGSVTSH